MRRARAGGPGGPPGETGEGGPELGRVDVVDVGVEARDGGGEGGPRPGADTEAAAVRSERLDVTVAGERDHVAGGPVQDDLAPAGPGAGPVGAREPGGEERAHVAAGHLVGDEARPGRDAGGDPVGAIDAPVLPLRRPGDEVPPTGAGHEVVGLDPPGWAGWASSSAPAGER